MGLVGKIENGVKKSASGVSDSVNKAADAASDAVESLGNVIGDALGALGKEIPGAGGIVGWLGDVVSSATDLLGGVIKWAGGTVGGVLGGSIEIVGGILTLDLGTTAEGLGDILSGMAGGLVLVLGKSVALVQVVFTVGRSRPLNRVELELIRLVFHDSIATYNVRVVDGRAGMFGLNRRPFVLGNTIYMKEAGADSDPGVFVHECVHVWQNQHAGARYVVEALASQWWGAGYDWEREADHGKDWMDFGREAQGEFIEDLYGVGGTAAGATGNGTFFAEGDPSLREFVFEGATRTKLANDATQVIRARTPWRLSRLGA